MGHPRWELADRETGRGFTPGDGTSKVGTGRQGDRKRNLTAGGWASWELAGREMGKGI